MTDSAGRVYAGRSDAQRRADRRDRLLAAGLELFGTQGWSGASIERLCACAGVATRSFYEEFPSRAALVQAVYDEVVAGSVAAVIAACRDAPPDPADRVRRGVTAFVRHLTEDPRRVQVVYREVRVAPGLQDHRHAVMLGSATVVERGLGLDVLPAAPQRRRVLTLALGGALSEVLVDWVASPPPRPALEPLLEELVRLFTAALTGPAGPGQALVGPVRGDA